MNHDLEGRRPGTTSGRAAARSTATASASATAIGLAFALLLAAVAPPRARAAESAAAPTWIGTWAAAAQAPLPGTPQRLRNQTLRLIVHTSAGGDRVRIRIANTFGDRPLVIGAAHVARRAAGADIEPASDRALRFAGATGITIAPGATASSDPADLDVRPASDLAVSLFLPRPTTASTLHVLALQTSYLSRPGDAGGAIAFPVAQTLHSWPFLAGVDVETPGPGATIVAFGDSTVDGDGTDPDTNRRWPDALAARLNEARAQAPEAADTPVLGVLNEGLIGNRLLSPSPPAFNGPGGPGLGRAGVDRFERDVLGQPGVRAVILRIGGNDLGFAGNVAPAPEPATPDRLIAGLRVLAARARAKGLVVVGTTLPPFEGTRIVPRYWTPAKEAIRLAVNDWIRTGGAFDAVVDVDALVRDPAHPGRLAPALDSGDHLHPNATGYAAIAGAMPLGLLRGR